jgi:O-antigen/teichoic acid export membrane protein
MTIKDTSDGRERMTVGLLVSWASQLLLMVSGFLIPRMIDQGMGPVTLGIWDFGWSLVSYFGLLDGGISGTVNRYVALERGKGDLVGINRVSSSAALLQRVVGGLILMLTIIVAWGIPYDLKGVSPELEIQARWMVFLLGCSMGLSSFGAIYTGVLTGCHRWATHHLIYAATNILSVIGMVVVLVLGYGVVALGVVHLSCEVTGRVLRGVYAYRACPGLRISMKLAERATLLDLLEFGGRVMVGQFSRIILAQTTSILIAVFLGPAALAMFVRPRSLVRQAAVFPRRYAQMLIPTVASISSSMQIEKVREFVCSSSRVGLYISLPIMIFLAIEGPSLIAVWMGPDYANGLLILVISITLASEVLFQPLDALLVGLNLHGRPALVTLGAAILAVLSAWVVLANGGGLVSVALAIGIPWTLAHGVYLPLYTCKRLEIRPLTFFRSVWCGPLLHALPFIVILATARWIFPDQPLYSLLGGGIIGGGVMATTYWIWVLPNTMKRKILTKLRLGRFVPSRPATP